MQHNDPTYAYRAAAIENAPPLKILRMLYTGALKFIAQAREAHAAGDLPAFNHCVGRAESIVSELRGSLDRTQQESLVDQLEALYLYSFSRMIDAIASSSVEPLDEVQEILTMLLDAWNQLEVTQQAS